MSFFDRQGIPEALVHGDQGAKRASIALETREGSTRRRMKQILGRAKSKPRAQKEQKESDGCRTGFEDDVVALRNLCLISVDANGSTFEMHSLVQLATRRWLTVNGKLERWKQQSVSNLCVAFPIGQYENWAACQALYAHAKAALGQQPGDEPSIAEWATVLYSAAWFAERIGNIADAEMLATKAMKARKKVLGQEHEDAVECGHGWASIQARRPLGRGGEAASASGEDKRDEARSGPSPHADQHEQPSLDVESTRSECRSYCLDEAVCAAASPSAKRRSSKSKVIPNSSRRVGSNVSRR
ncbi:unnamed protein product [Alternaria alternata]